MRKRQITPFRPVYPSPAGLVTCADATGKPNIITLGEIFNLSIRDPVIVGIAIAKARYSHELISATGEYVVNLPTAKVLAAVDRCGSVSGRRTDKFSTFGLTPVPALHVTPPLIAECPVNIECRVRDILVIGDHDLFVGDVLAVHVDEDCLEGNRILTDRLDAFCFINWEYRAVGDRLARVGYTRS